MPHAHDVGRGQHDFEAVLAGVAGAGDEPAVDLLAEERFAARGLPWRRPATAAVASFRARFGPCTAIIARSVRSVTSTSKAAACCRIHARSLSRVPRVHDHAEPGVRQEVDDEVVDDARRSR